MLSDCVAFKGESQGLLFEGVCGILVDRKFTWYNFSWVNLGNGLGSMKHIVKHDGTNLHIRLANRQDDPFLIRR